MIIGHAKAKERLDRRLAAGSVSGAYVFSGPEGVGKWSLALEFASRLNGSRKNDRDILAIRPSREETKGIARRGSIGIESVRDLQAHLYLSADGSGHRIAIIDEAETLTKAAQNALLKILEEPPLRSLAIMVTGDRSKLLPTIVSRCQTVGFSLLSDQEIGRALEERGHDRPELVPLAFGRPGWAIRMAEDEAFLASMRESARDLDSVVGGDLNVGFDLAERMSKDRDGTIRELSIWTAILRNAMLGREAREVPRKRTIRAIGSIFRTIASLSLTNANARLALEALFLEMGR